MKRSAIFTRRDFIKQSSLAGTAMLLPIPSISDDTVLKDHKVNKDLEVHLFSKHLQFLNYKDMSEAAKEMGFDGLDLTVRPGGHILPEKVEDELPAAVETMKHYGLAPKLMTTKVTDANNTQTETILKTAAKQGIDYYRMGWLKYPENKTISQGIEIFTQQFEALEKMNRKFGIHGDYQNHSGKNMGAMIWDLYQILEHRSADWIGCQYDIRHAYVEGGFSWEIGLNLIKDFIKTIVIKDFKWGKTDGQWRPINTPLGEGMVDFKKYFSLLKKYNINVPVSLHFEYDLGGAEKGKSDLSIDKKEVFDHMKKDLNYLRELWEKAQ